METSYSVCVFTWEYRHVGFWKIGIMGTDNPLVLSVLGEYFVAWFLLQSLF